MIGFDNVAIPKGRLEHLSFFSNSLNFRQNGIYLFNASSIKDGSSPVTSSSLWVIENKELYGDSDYLVQSLYGVGQSVCYIRFVTDTSFGSWQRIDNFGYNTLADLSSAVAEQMGFYLRKMNIGDSETCLVVKKNTSKYIKIIAVNHVSDVMFSIEIYNGQGYINCRKILALKNKAGFGECYVKQDSNNIYVYTSWGGSPTSNNSYVFADSSAILSNGTLPSQVTDVEELT